jgi:hypothetical protein
MKPANAIAPTIDKLGNDTSTQIQHLAANVDVTNVRLFHTLGIPVSGGLGLGFVDDSHTIMTLSLNKCREKSQER